MFNINDIFSINGSLHKPLPPKNLPQPDLDDACILQTKKLLVIREYNHGGKKI